ncbi:MAG: alanine:cation symporter family protein, partial [Bacteroidota bacterium]
TDMIILDGQYTDTTEEGRKELAAYLKGEKELPAFDGQLSVRDGMIQNEVSIINARSLAEEVIIKQDGEKLTGSINIINGKPADLLPVFEGKSLIHSSPLTAEAFTRSFIGDWGQYIVSIGLLMFAFSTAISWSYYGDRAMTYLFGSSSVKYYRLVYVVGFFIASFADTTIIWTLSAIAIAVMTLPNLVGILMLSKDMKSTVSDFWMRFKEDFPDEKAPE